MRDEKIRTRILEHLLSEQEPEEDTETDEDTEDTEDTTSDEDDFFSDEDIESIDSEEDPDDAEDTDADEDLSSDDSEDSLEDPQEQFASDNEKVETLFKDSGTPEQDYSLTNENNIRLAKFRFLNSGINPFDMMSEIERQKGVRVDELISRLSPDEYEVYLEKGKTLRKDFKLIAEREKKVIIYNSNIPMYFNDQKGNRRKITHPNDEAQAIKRVLDYMDRVFGENWVDNQKAVKFLSNIKINFSEDPKIRPNLVEASLYKESDRPPSVFNIIFFETPKSVQRFIESNQEITEYMKSSIFRTLASDFIAEGTGSSKSSVYAVLKEEGDAAGSDDVEDETLDSEDAEGDFGGFGAEGEGAGEDMSDFGDEDLGDLGDLGDEDLGAEEGEEDLQL
jgi:hypothetical protein